MTFENFGQAPASTEDRMECGVCWSVYDPAAGDPVWQVAPGTPFAQLPEDWRCPVCDAPRGRFMRLGDGR
jgi:rubredoxin